MAEVSERKAPASRFYMVSHQGDWARIWVTDDGSIVILSSYGAFGYWFTHPGCEIRRFLSGSGPDYLAGKFAGHGGKIAQREAKGFLKKLWPLFVEQLTTELSAEASMTDHATMLADLDGRIAKYEESDDG